MTEIILYNEEKTTAATLFNGGGLDPFIENIKKVADDFDADVTTEKGRKAIKSLAYKISNAKNRVDEMRQEENAEHQAVIKTNNEKGKKAWNELQSLQDAVKKPVTDWENRIKEHQEAIEALAYKAEFARIEWENVPLEELKNLLSDTKNIERDWQEFSFKAEAVKKQSIEQIEAYIAKREKHDADQAELEKLRLAEEARKQKERDEQIAEAAAEKAKFEAEQKAAAEKLASEARERATEEKAEAERLAAEKRIEEAEARAKASLQALKDADSRTAAEKLATAQREQAALEKAKRDRQEVIDRLQKEADDQKKAEAAALAKREADQKHKGTILRAIDDAFVEQLALPKRLATEITLAISNGKIPHITINF